MGEKTLRQALEQYCAIHMPARNFALRTRKEYLADLEDLVEFLEEKAGISRVGELNLHSLERYLAELDGRGLAGSTRKRKTISIRSFLDFLYRQDFIATDLAKRLIPPFAGNPTPRYLTQSEYQRLLKASRGNSRDTAIIELLLQTGIRLSELTRLTVDDIDLPEKINQESKQLGTIRVNGGGSRMSRSLPLNTKACRVLLEYLKFRPRVSSVLFLNRFKKPLGPRGIQKIISKYAKVANIPSASVHGLRHTFGAQHAARGTSLKTIQEVLGHQDIRTTEIYATLGREVVRRELQENAL